MTLRSTLLKRVIEEIKDRPHVYTTQEGIEEI